MPLADLSLLALPLASVAATAQDGACPQFFPGSTPSAFANPRLDALPEALQDTATAKALWTVCDLAFDELQAVEPPNGFRRD